MKKTIAIAMPVTLLIALYLCLWPVPVEPVAWQAPQAPGFTGPHAANTRLQGVQQIGLHGETGPEHVLVGPDGKLYTGVVSGRILRMELDGSAQQVFSDTGGRPLGMAFDKEGKLLVADAVKGLLSVGTDGKVALLADKVDGTPVRFADAVVVARNGKVYFTDASTRFYPPQWGSTMDAATLDVIEQSATGRVVEYDPASGATRIVAQGLSFANGIALSGDEASLLVCETGRYRVWKIDIATSQRQVFLDNLPGYPDNLMRGQDGRIWLGFAGQRNDLDKMAQWPSLRRVALRLPRFMWREPPPYGHVVAFTEDGKVVEDLQDPSGQSPVVTGATEAAGRLYIHSADSKGLAWLPRKEAVR